MSGKRCAYAARTHTHTPFIRGNHFYDLHKTDVPSPFGPVRPVPRQLFFTGWKVRTLRDDGTLTITRGTILQFRVDVAFLSEVLMRNNMKDTGTYQNANLCR